MSILASSLWGASMLTFDIPLPFTVGSLSVWLCSKYMMPTKCATQCVCRS